MADQWKIRRGSEEFTAESSEQLHTWARRGRVLPTDSFLLPGSGGKWTAGNEVKELAADFTFAGTRTAA